MTPVTSLVATGYFFGKKRPKPVTSLVKIACNLLEYIIVFSSKDILKIYLRGKTALLLRAGGFLPFGKLIKPNTPLEV
jgi:hypothetical protein